MAEERGGAKPESRTSPVGSTASFRVEHDGNVVVHVAGELDAQSGSELSDLLARAFRDRPPSVIVDLTDVDFVDSVGLSVLVAAHHRGHDEGISFQVHHVAASCMRVFEITQLDDVLDLR